MPWISTFIPKSRSPAWTVVLAGFGSLKKLEEAVHTGPCGLHDPLEILQSSLCLHSDVSRNYFPGFVDRSLPRNKQQFSELDSGRKWKTKRRGTSFHSFPFHMTRIVGLLHWCLRVENQHQLADQ